MALYINTNIWSLNAQRALSASQADLTRALERLSTTLRINRASDDPTGHAIVERYTSQINGVDQARRNVSHGTVFVQHADSNLKSINNQLQNIRAKIVAADADGLSVAQRQTLQDEIVVLLNEVERIAQTTEFDGRKILNNATTNTIFQVGPNAADTVSVATNDFRISRFGVHRLFGNGTGTSPTGARGGTGERITIEGYLGLEKVVIPAATTGLSSAKEIAKAVNAVQAGTGVSATARTELEVTGWAPVTYALQLEAANVNDPKLFDFSPVAGVLPGTVDLSSAISTFNMSSVSTETGIVMSLNKAGDGVILTSAAGDNIAFGPGSLTPPLAGALTLKPANYTGSATDTNRVQTLAAGATVGRTYTGQVIFDSERPFTIMSEPLTSTSPVTVATTAYPASGLVLKKPTTATAAKATESSSLNPADPTTDPSNAVSVKTSLLGIDVTKGPASVRQALAIVDGALAAVASQRAVLGATQNRFKSIIDNLDDDFVNLTTARGYIRDADIALESSIQTRASIQHEVNIAILGQANALQQAVLALLR